MIVSISFLINSQFTVPPPSTKIVSIFLVESFLINNFKLTEFSPETIISTGNFLLVADSAGRVQKFSVE